ncbi:MAG: hypothetical protein KC615_13465 [Anaerolineae bacterium]|nr:hypothetical protein [Anaerolineae bacterium]
MGSVDLAFEHLAAKWLYDKAIESGLQAKAPSSDDLPAGLLTAFQWGPVTVQILNEGERYGYKLLLPDMPDFQGGLDFNHPENAAAYALLHIRHLRDQIQQQENTR